MRNVFLFFIYGILMRTFLRIIAGVKYINKEAINKHPQFILVSNHNSHLDTMALMSVLKITQLKTTHPVAAGDYFGKSPFRAFITKLFTNALLIKRSKTSDGQNPIDLMSESLLNGDSLILFPEGSRGEPQKMQQFKKGIGIILNRHPQIPFIPVYMTGMGKILPKGEMLLVPFDSYVVFGKAQYCKSSEVEDIVHEIEGKIIELSINFRNERYQKN